MVRTPRYSKNKAKHQISGYRTTLSLGSYSACSLSPDRTLHAEPSDSRNVPRHTLQCPGGRLRYQQLRTQPRCLCCQRWICCMLQGSWSWDRGQRGACPRGVEECCALAIGRLRRKRWWLPRVVINFCALDANAQWLLIKALIRTLVS